VLERLDQAIDEGSLGLAARGGGFIVGERQDRQR
jgi:hypothetical protein